PLVGAVELFVTAKPAAAKFHRSVWRHFRERVLSSHWSGILFPRRGAARLRRRQTLLSTFAGDCASAVDHSLHCFRGLSVATTNALLLLLEKTKHSGTGRIDRLCLRQ